MLKSWTRMVEWGSSNRCAGAMLGLIAASMVACASQPATESPAAAVTEQASSGGEPSAEPAPQPETTAPEVPEQPAKDVEVEAIRVVMEPDFQVVEPGDVVEVRDKSRNMALVLEALQSGERDFPDYIEVDAKAMSATFARVPEFSDVPYPVQMEPNLVVEFYSS